MTNVTILDGGFSTQLENYVEGQVDGDPLWTAKFLKLEPKKCALVHRDFVIAGAQIISTGSYQSSVEGYKRYLGMDEDEALELIRSSMKLAKEGILMAEKETGKKFSEVQVAGSVGPYGAFLHDGSEYTGSYCGQVTTELLVDWHRPRVEALLAAGADLLALETIPCLKEALALIHLLKEFPKAKAWISFSVKDIDTISSGESLSVCAARCWEESDQLIAVGANCFHPSLVTPMFRMLVQEYSHIPIVVYPNNGEIYDRLSQKWLNKEVTVNIEDYVHEWLDMGIRYIGGCCRSGSKDISRIICEVQRWKQKRNLN